MTIHDIKRAVDNLQRASAIFTKNPKHLLSSNQDDDKEVIESIGFFSARTVLLHLIYETFSGEKESDFVIFDKFCNYVHAEKMAEHNSTRLLLSWKFSDESSTRMEQLSKSFCELSDAVKDVPYYHP